MLLQVCHNPSTYDMDLGLYLPDNAATRGEMPTMTDKINGHNHNHNDADPRGRAQDPVAIANYFIEKARADGKHLSIFQLVKLVYLAHGWCLGYTGEPLIRTKAKAWRHGPVVEEVYNAFRPQGIHNIDRPVGEIEPDWSDADKQTIVDAVYEQYSNLHPFTLSAMTHQRGTPWAKTEGRHYAPIDDETIREYYARRVGQKRQKSGN